MEAEATVLQYPPMTDSRGDDGGRGAIAASAPTSTRPESARPREDDDPGAALLARYLDGETAAFEALVHHYRSPIYGYLLRSGVTSEVADEIFQETFLRVHQHGHSYRPMRPFRVWLFTITNNLLRSHYRKRKVRRILVDWWLGASGPDAHPIEPESHAPLPEEHAAARESLAWLERALTHLPDGPRRALLLTQVEGLSGADAALALGVPEATVKTWVRRGRLALVDARRREGGTE
ncbi:MAG: RNA polymerase sigma factor [Deltaproteobacteria bacterium]|nr:MAG: RNA polymerase sigma factor [Deltaproteobacteria bacterium]